MAEQFSFFDSLQSLVDAGLARFDQPQTPATGQVQSTGNPLLLPKEQLAQRAAAGVNVPRDEPIPTGDPLGLDDPFSGSSQFFRGKSIPGLPSRTDISNFLGVGAGELATQGTGGFSVDPSASVPGGFGVTPARGIGTIAGLLGGPLGSILGTGIGTAIMEPGYERAAGEATSPYGITDDDEISGWSSFLNSVTFGLGGRGFDEQLNDLLAEVGSFPEGAGDEGTRDLFGNTKQTPRQLLTTDFRDYVNQGTFEESVDAVISDAPFKESGDAIEPVKQVYEDPQLERDALIDRLRGLSSEQYQQLSDDPSLIGRRVREMSDLWDIGYPKSSPKSLPGTVPFSEPLPDVTLAQPQTMAQAFKGDDEGGSGGFFGSGPDIDRDSPDSFGFGIF